MINFAVVGTSKITENFISTAQLFPNFHLDSVYSRDYNKGLEFSKKFNCSKVYTDLDQLGKDSDIQAVYIASPNFLHAKHSIKLMNYKKHILCEKPFASNSREVVQMIDCAKENNVLLMEAMKTTFMPLIQSIKDNIDKIGKVRKVFFNYCQYSSRYDAFRQGEVQNAFKKELSNGALVDIGVYSVFAMHYLFGKPKKISASGVFLNTGVDGCGSATFNYGDFLGDVHYSKISNSLIPSEIQGEDGNIIINSLSIGGSGKIHLRNGEIMDLGTEIKDSFYYEVQEFLSLIENKKIESQINSHKLSLDVMNSLEQIRVQIGLKYPADDI